MRMRWTAYAGVSTTLAAGVVVKALAQRPNFYSAAVYLAQSSANLMIMCNLVFMLACGSLLLLQKILYGPLRPIEIEQLYEKAWFAVTETCLAMTIFRGEIGASFLIMFFALLAGKVWGWIGEGRVEILEQQPPANPRLFHTRLMVSLLLSVAFDMTMLDYIVKEVVGMARPDMMVMFGFEFAVLTVLSLSTLARYAISLMEILIIRTQKEKRMGEIRQERRDARAAHATTQPATQPATEQMTGVLEIQQSGTTNTPEPTPPTGPSPDDPIDDADIEVEGWEDKGRYVFYLDLVTDFFKLVIYLTFFCILLVFYGLPIHIMRDVFLTCRSFFKRIADFIRYRTATRDMNERYPDATPEDIGREDVCIICREEMRAVTPPIAGAEGAAPPVNPVVERMRPKKLPCGHILHFSCLRSWLERQQICPTCRRPVVPLAAQQIRIGGQNLPAVPGLPGQNGAQAAAIQPQQAQGQGADGQNRARVFQLGPLRIGVGAGRGMFDDLVQQIHNGEEAPVQERNVNGPPQYGFGFGIGRGPRRARRDRPTTVHGQIDDAQRQIQQEIENLRLATNELQVVRMLQGELERLRGLRQAGTDDGTTAATGHHTPAPAMDGRSTALSASSHENVLQAGSEALPEGLTLPEGWTMMPLHRINQSQAPSQVLTHSAMQAANSLNGTSANRQPVPVQSMFSGVPASWAPLQPGQQTQGTQSQSNGITQEDLHRAFPPEQASINTTASPARPSNMTPEALRNELVGFSRALDRLGASPVPPSQPNTVPTFAVNGSSSPAVTLPSIPSWGASAPLADPVATQPAIEETAATAGAVESHASASSPSNEDSAAKSSNAPATTNGESSSKTEEGATSEESSRSKGKTAKVEDFIEDPD